VLTVENWFVACLTEREAQKLIRHVDGAMAHGVVKSFPLLPKVAQDILRAEFDRVMREAGE
jgi:hypothetical protein